MQRYGGWESMSKEKLGGKIVRGEINGFRHTSFCEHYREKNDVGQNCKEIQVMKMTLLVINPFPRIKIPSLINQA